MKRCPLCAKAFPDEGLRACTEHGLPLVEQRVPAPKQVGRLTDRVIEQRYLLAGLVGKGGMGDVYAAENLRVGRIVAVKVLHPELHLDAKMRVRLFREVQATSRISHPNVVEILDYGQDNDAGCYLVMEFLRGRSLSALIRRRGRLRLDTALKITEQLALGLSATHAHGLIHRDLKPSNVRILPSGRVKVLDFGLVKAFERADEDAFLTITTGGIAFGTPWYMSPEQAALRPLDPRSDIYSLGIVLYEMLVGRTPFVGSNALELLEAQRSKPVPLPRYLDPPADLPVSVELLLLMLLNKDPERRPQTMAELVDRLHAVAHEHGIDLTDQRALGLDASPHETSSLPLPQPSELLQQPATAAKARVDERIRQLVFSRMDAFCEGVVSDLQRSFPRYRALTPEQALQGTRAVVRAAIAAAYEEDQGTTRADLRRLAHERVEQQFPLGEALGSFLVGLSHLRPLLAEIAERDLGRFLALHEQVDTQLMAFFLRLVDDYLDMFNAKLIRLNDQLSRRNAELIELREELQIQLKATSRQLGSLERLKARLVENASSGLALIERETRKVLLCNKAVERMFGLPVSELLGRSIDDILRRVEGVPQDEFIEQIRLHGYVGLRKLRIKVSNGAERVIYLRGEVFDPPGEGAPGGTIFVLDDVSEREELVRGYSRYVAADVARDVTRGRAGQERRSTQLVALFALRLTRWDSPAAYRDDLAIEAFSCLLSRVAAQAQPGDSVHVPRPGLVVVRSSHDRAVTAALAAWETIREAMERDGHRPEDAPGVAAALHFGEVLVADVGDERRTERLVLGDTYAQLLALTERAAPGELLLSHSALSAADLAAPATELQLEVNGEPLVAYAGPSRGPASDRERARPT